MRRDARPAAHERAESRGAARRPIDRRRRRAARVHAVAGAPRGPPRSGRHGRGHGGRAGPEDRVRGRPAAARPAAEGAAGHARPGRDRRQHPPGIELGRTRRPHRVRLRGCAPDPAWHREVHARRSPHRHRRRQPLRARRRGAGRQPVPAPPRPARQPARLVAQPLEPELPVLGPVRRADEPEPVLRRGARRPGLRGRDRAERDRAPGGPVPPGGGRRRGGRAAVAGGPHAAPPADRRHRQHASHRVLHRQAVLARRRHRAARAARAARPRRVVLAPAVHRGRRDAARALGHGAARPLRAAYLRADGPRRRGRRAGAGRLRVRRAVVRAALRVPLPADRRDRRRRPRAEPAQRARALARDGRGRCRRRHGGLRRLVARATRGQGHGPQRQPPRGHRQRPCTAAAAHGPLRRVRLRRAPPRVAAAFGAAPDDRRARAADVRRRRQLAAALARRLPPPRRPPRRAQRRQLPGQRPRGREPAAGALLPLRPNAGGRCRWRPRPRAGNSRSRSTCASAKVARMPSTASAPP